MTDLSIMTWNIANPSAERAQRQLAWLAQRPEDVFVLTETKRSEGCDLLGKSFRAANYLVVGDDPPPGELGTMIISRVDLEIDNWAASLDCLPSRACSALLPTAIGAIHLIGLYVPSRDASPEKTHRKMEWIVSCRRRLHAVHGRHAGTLLLGDLNVLEPDHRPRYPFFADFEYEFYRGFSGECGLVDAFRHLNREAVEHSWVGRTGDGYRYDHAFCSKSLTDTLTKCRYLHEPRQARLSDHSALTLSLRIEPGGSRSISNPEVALKPLTLF